MSQPPPYAPVTSFITYQAQQSWFPGQNLDVEFNDIETSITAIRTNLALIQKDDGTLGNGSVGFPQLSTQLATALTNIGVAVPISTVLTQPNTWTGLQTFPGGANISGDVAQNVLYHGAKGDGVTNDAAAFSAMSAAGGVYYIPDGVVCAIGGTVTFSSNSAFLLGVGAQLKWTGGSSGTMFTSSNASSLVNFKLGSTFGKSGASLSQAQGTTGGNIYAGAIGKVFDLHSMQHCTFENLIIYVNSATATGFKAIADSNVGYAGLDGQGNTAWCNFTDIHFTGLMGTGWLLGGSATLVNGVQQVFTLNTFNNLTATDVITVCGINLVSWFDSNNFMGNMRFSIFANNAVGMIINSASPAGSVGVYSNYFQSLAIDCFGVFTGRVALQVNYSYDNIIDLFEPDNAEAGKLVTTNAFSYLINQVNSGTDGSILTTSLGRAITMSVADNVNWLFAGGATSALRCYSNSFGTLIEGVNPADNAFRPIILGGFTIAFTASGVTKADYSISVANTWTFSSPVVVLNGNLAVGTSTPLVAAGYGTISVNGANGGVASFQVSGTEYFRIQVDTGADIALFGIANVPMIFYTNNAEHMRLSAAGGLNLGTGGTDAGAKNLNVEGVYKSSGTQVVSTRQTGWTVATGTPSRATFTTAGVTLATLAGVVMALEQDLIAHGLIGT